MKIIKIYNCADCCNKFKMDHLTFEKCPFMNLKFDEKSMVNKIVQKDCPLEGYQENKNG